MVATVLLTVILLVGVADSKQIERNLKADYEGRVVTLRDFYQGDRLRYDPTGNLLEGGKPGLWTLHAHIELRKLRLRRDRLEIQGNRWFAAYDPAKKQFRNLRGPKVTIHVQLGGEGVAESDLRSVLGKIFLDANAQLTELVPHYWKEYLINKTGAGAPASNVFEPPPPPNVYRIGVSVSPPVCLSCPGPDYSSEARKAGYSAVVVLWIVVDAKGRVVPDSLRILRPAGMGLDEMAIQAVLQWRFKPAERFGQPVPVHMQVEVNFRLSGNP